MACLLLGLRLQWLLSLPPPCSLFRTDSTTDLLEFTFSLNEAQLLVCNKHFRKMNTPLLKFTFSTEEWKTLKLEKLQQLDLIIILLFTNLQILTIYDDKKFLIYIFKIRFMKQEDKTMHMSSWNETTNQICCFILTKLTRVQSLVVLNVRSKVSFLSGAEKLNFRVTFWTWLKAELLPAEEFKCYLKLYLFLMLQFY